ncbi:MAG: hypothetical protein J7603_23505 [Pseudacidovorax sp.]|nr:hypothetical protein [Pseudacidovorax sp.]
MNTIVRVASMAASAGALCLATGCASVTHGAHQSVRIDTHTAAGEAVKDADCRLSNDRSETAVRSGQTAEVRRSAGNLTIQCQHDGQPPASGQVISRVNAGMVGNVMIGGLIGVAIDSSTGAGFNYPSWVRLVFGEVRTFDRGNQTADQPELGLKIGETQFAKASSATDAPAVPAPAMIVALPPAPAAPPARTERPLAAPRAPANDGATPFAGTRLDELKQLLPTGR